MKKQLFLIPGIGNHIGRLKTLWTMFSGEFYSLALSQPLVAFHLNGGEMNEDIILTIVTL